MSEDFFARESNVLGSQFSPSAGAGSFNDGDFDFDKAASQFPDIDGFDDALDGPVAAPAPLQQQQHQPSTNGSFSFDALDGPSAPPMRDVKVTETDEFDKFESDFPDLEPQTVVSPPVINQFQSSVNSSTPTFAPRPTQSSALSNAPVLQHTEDDEEPEVIRQWRAKQQEEIRKRDEASEAKRDQTIRKAEGAIDQFYEDYNVTKEKNIKANKESEAAFLASLTDSLSEGSTWSRICKLLELENSQSKTLARSGAGTSDLTRYKEVLLRLKREGDNAPGAAGY